METEGTFDRISLPVAGITWPELSVSFSNAAFKDWYGDHKPSESICELIPELNEKILRKRITSNRPFMQELPQPPNNGRVLKVCALLGVLSEEQETFLLELHDISIAAEKDAVIKSTTILVDQYTEKLKIQHSKLDSLFFALDQGCLQIDENLTVVTEGTHITSQILGEDVVGQNFLDLLSRQPEAELSFSTGKKTVQGSRDTLSFLLQSACQNKSEFKSVSDKLPSQLHLQNKIYSLKFKSTDDSMLQGRLLITLTDCTEEYTVYETLQAWKNASDLVSRQQRLSQQLFDVLARFDESWFETAQTRELLSLFLEFMSQNLTELKDSPASSPEMKQQLEKLQKMWTHFRITLNEGNVSNIKRLGDIMLLQVHRTMGMYESVLGD